MERDTIEIIVRFFVLTVSLTIHEFAHAWSAFRLGDDTAASMGRMTLNPLAHLDPVGSLLILTGMPLGWAKPVPVNYARLHDPRRSGSLVAFAGPASNLLLGIICAAVFKVMSYQAVGTGWFQLLIYFIQINFGLAVFNLLPLPPLDGAAVLGAVVPEPYAKSVRQFSGNPMASTLGLLVAWQLFPQLTGPIFLFVLRLVHPGLGYH